MIKEKLRRILQEPLYKEYWYLIWADLYDRYKAYHHQPNLTCKTTNWIETERVIKNKTPEMLFQPCSAKRLALFFHLSFTYMYSYVALFTWVIAESQILPAGLSRKRSTRRHISASDESPGWDLFPRYAVDWPLRPSDS